MSKRTGSRREGENTHADARKAPPEKRKSARAREEQGDTTRWLLGQTYVLRQAGLEKDEFIKDMLYAGALSDDAELRDDISEMLEAQVIEAVTDGPFAPRPPAERLSVPGTLLAQHYPTGADFCWADDEQKYPALVLGGPGGGKTNGAYWAIERLSQVKDGVRKACVWVWDLRFDYVGLAKVLPHTKAILISKAKWNVLRPPTGVPAAVWFSAFAGKIADHLDLMIAGREFLARHLGRLYQQEFARPDRWPAVRDLIIYVEELKCRSRDEEGYRARALEKLRVFEAASSVMLDCEQGYDFEKLLDESWNVIFVMGGQSKNICDLLTATMMDFVYYYRMYNDEKPRSRLFLVLDEQRHLIRERKWR